MTIELGISTFGETTLLESTGKAISHDQRIRELVEEIELAAHSWGWIEENNFQAIENYFYPTKQTVDNIAKDRPHWSEMTKKQYYASVGPNGAMFVGDSTHVAQKIIRIVEDLQLNRFMLHLPIGSMPHEDVLKAIKLYGEEVAPIVRSYFENKG